MRVNNAAKKIKEPLTVSEELLFLKDTNGGFLDPAKVVEYARNPDTALHTRFEWDNGEAAEKYRLWQARQVIRLELTITPLSEESPKEIRAFVSLQADRGSGGYRTILDVLSNDDLRGQLLEEARRDMRIFRKKYNTLNELASVFSAMEEVGVSP
jgi:hypothetical protein